MSLQKNNYAEIVLGLKQKIRDARINASVVVNIHLLEAYWEIGNTILKLQAQEKWGAKVIDTLAGDLKLEFPDFKGLSVRNLKYMRAFAEAYPEFAGMNSLPLKQDSLFVQPAVAQMQISDNQNYVFVQSLIAQIPWTHHITILDKVKDTQERLFYIQKTIEQGWSKVILSAQIEKDLYNRQGRAITNFTHTLPAAQSDLAQQTLKSPYVFDFLTFGEDIKERDLEKAMIQHLKKFMLELGKGFAYVGNQKNIVVDGDDFFLDLLFYNYNLHCFVIFELKIGDFKPEFAGKLNFYVNTVNQQLKGIDDKPTIGVLLCKTPNETVVQYSLQGIASPIGVADYQLADALPATLKGDIPTVEELEEEIEKEYEELKKPYEKKLDQVKSLLRSLNQPQLKETRNAENVRKIFFEVVFPVLEEMKKALHAILPEFEDIEYRVWIDGSGYNKLEDTLKWFEDNNTEVPNSYRITIELRGCKTAGVKAFNVWKDLYVENNTYFYKVCFDQHRQEGAILEKLYHEFPTAEEMEKVIEKYTDAIAEDIQRNVERIQREMNNE